MDWLHWGCDVVYRLQPKKPESLRTSAAAEFSFDIRLREARAIAFFIGMKTDCRLLRSLEN